jgi:hypothetical protein
MQGLSVLYFVRHNETGLTKIGITSNWSARSTALKVGKKTKLLGIYECEDALTAEKDLHERARKYRLPGSEYFNLQVNDLKQLLCFAEASYKCAKQKLELFSLHANSKMLDVSQALDWSASDWFRLIKNSWRRSILDDVKNCIDEELTLEEFLQFKDEIMPIKASLLKEWQKDLYGEAYGEYLAIKKIWAEFYSQKSCAISKHLFNIHRCRSGIKCRPKRKLSFSNDISCKWSSFDAVINGQKISLDTLGIIYRLVCCYRFEEYCSRAFDALLTPGEFEYYLEHYGPHLG